MDIDLLSKMVKELILDRDEVTLPGVGTFVAETVPASFSDRGYTINPPYRRLSFRQRQNAEDNCLIELYARSNGIDQQQASRFLLDFLMEMKEVLKQKKSIVFPGLGRLRSTKENNFFFVADEDLDIYPEGFGLEPISLKTHQETPEEVTDAIQKLKAVVMAPAESASPAEEEGAVVGSVSSTTTVPSDVEESAAVEVEEPIEILSTDNNGMPMWVYGTWTCKTSYSNEIMTITKTGIWTSMNGSEDTGTYTYENGEIRATMSKERGVVTSMPLDIQNKRIVYGGGYYWTKQE